jgi:transcriptional regulator with XRE-family HTH domain
MANFIVIRDLCERRKITIRKLASMVGKEESTIQAIIKNGSTNTTTLEKIAQALDVPIGYFFDNNPPSSINQNIKGNINAASVYGNASILNCESELEIAKKELDHLRELLQEKERTIQILIKKE